MSFDPKKFADEISGKLVTILESKKGEIVAGAGGWARREAVKLAWPTLIGEVPPLTETLIELVSWKFGSLTVDDLLEALAQIKKSSNLAGLAESNGAGEGQLPRS